MDIVITYVNGLDPLWQQDYQQHTNIPILEKRFRDWGTLQYLFRGIEINMPFIRKVHLIVARESQVPHWINRDTVNVVLHKDIIPEQYLPTFNCNPIEMNLHRIKGLDEEFIYFNDDIFPVAPCKPSDFFTDGKPMIGYSRHFMVMNMFKNICRNSDRAARKALRMRPSLCFTRPQHVCMPLLKSQCDKLYEILSEEIAETSSHKVRTKDDLNEYMFLNYMNYQGMVIHKRISKKHFSASVATGSKLKSFLLKPTHTFVCINDVQLTDEKYNELRQAVIDAFEQTMPEKSKFEK